MIARLLNTIDGGFQALANPLLLACRLLLGWFFVPAGIDKIENYSNTVQFMESNGVPGLLLPLVILLEILGPVFLALGLLTRLTALAMALFTILADVIFNIGDTSSTGQYLYQAELVIVSGFLALMAVGGGQWALDALRGRTGRAM
ncbi:MAG: DoxX family protein [Hyphomicrobiales bacterium]|nr:DoxX family protein [Hyphomicrobiales bacterium]